MKKSKRLRKTELLAKIGIFSAVAFALQLIVFFWVGFLAVEASDVPACLIAFMEGPVAGLLIELVKNLIHLTITETGGLGELANFVTSGSFVFTAGLLYKLLKNKQNNQTKSLIIACSVATIVFVISAFLVNLYIFLPLYEFTKALSFSEKIKLVVFTITPFNLGKGVVLSLISIPMYTKISKYIKK